MTLFACLLLSLPGPLAIERVVLEDPAGEVSIQSVSELGLDDLERAVLIRFEGFEAPARPLWSPLDRAELELLGGDRLVGHVVNGRGDLVDVEVIGGASVPVVVDRLRTLRFPHRIEAAELSGLLPPDEGDRLYWISRGGIDRVDGTIEAFDEDGVRFDSVLGAKTFPWEEIAALFVEPFPEEGAADVGAEGRPVVLDLVDGSRLRGALTALGAEGAVLDVRGSGSLAFPLTTLSEIISDTGRIAFLSDLAPSGVVEGSPFDDDVGMSWPHRVDRSVTGGPLVSHGRRYARGLGVHAPSRLTWTLNGRWSELRGAVGIDDSVLLLPHQGSVVFRVHVDGEMRWESGLVRGGRPPLSLPKVDLSGANELVLEVDMATRFHVADRANWLRLLLVE
jgi:hypothetical protein